MSQYITCISLLDIQDVAGRHWLISSFSISQRQSSYTASRDDKQRWCSSNPSLIDRIVNRCLQQIMPSAYLLLSHSVNSSPLDKMVVISQTTFLNVFSWIKMFEFWLKCHWNLFLQVQSTESISSGNGLVPIRRQAIIWTNADPVHWLICTVLGGDELNKK